MKWNFKRLCALILALSFGISLMACANPGAAEPPVNNEYADDGNPYPYGSVNYNGRSYDIVNVPSGLWNFYTDIIYPPEDTSDHLKEAVYKRQEYVEQRLGISITQYTTGEIGDLLPFAQKMVATGDTTYELVYQCSSDTPHGIIEGLYLELTQIPQFKLEESYWNQGFMETASIANKLYMLMSDLNLMSVEGIWVLFFNQNMLEDLNLDYPYQLVREQKWTIEKFFEYCSACADLGTETAWDFGSIQPGKTSVYGCISMKESMFDRLIYSMGATFIEKDRTTDLPYWTGESERMNGAITKIANGTKVKGNFIGAASSLGDTHYLDMFVQKKCVFLGAELKEGHATLQKLDDTFGVVPFPKYDEYQEDYRSTFFVSCPAITLLSNTPDVAYAAFVADALSYETERTVIDTYYDVTLTQRSIRNEESAQMIDEFVLPCRGCDMGELYYWVGELVEDMGNRVMNGSANQSARIAKYAPSIQKQIEDLIDVILNEGKKN